MASDRLSFVPLLPPGLITLLALAVAAGLALAMLRRRRGSGWRLLAAAALVLALLQPVRQSETREPLADIVALVTDRSASTALAGRHAAIAEAESRLRERLGQIGGIELRSAELTPADDQGGDGSRLFGRLAQVLADVPPDRLGGVLLLTDGQVHDVPLAAGSGPKDNTAAGLPGAPVHALILGRRGERDRRLVVRQAPRYGLVGKSVSITLAVAEGEDDAPVAEDAEPTVATVTLTVGQAAPETVDIGVGEPLTVELPIQHGGANLLQAKVNAGPDELTLANNQALIAVSGVRDRLKVLLVSGEPHPGERVWRNLLKADPAVDLIHYTILRPPTKQDDADVRELSLIHFPSPQLFGEKLADFDLVIFDRYQRRGIITSESFENVFRHVRAGGALLVAGGADFASPLGLFRTPIAPLLPAVPTGEVITQGFRPAVTGIGSRHAITAGLASGAWGDAAHPRWGRWWRIAETTPRAGQTLMRDDDGRPLLQIDRVGEGRVALLLSDHAWLWARGIEGGGPQAELLRRTAHWLMKEPELEENSLTGRVVQGRLDVRRRSLDADNPTVTVTLPGGETRLLPLADQGQGLAAAQMALAEPGLYRLDDGRRQALVAVGSLNPLEYSDVRATARRLEPVAAATGGSLHWIAEDGLPQIRRVAADRDPRRPAGGKGWLGLVENRRHLVSGARQDPLLSPTWLLLLALGGLMMAWWRESS